MLTMRSNDLSARSRRFVASPSWKRQFASASARARRLPAATRLRAMSTPRTSAPRRAAGTAVVPSPQPRSSTRELGVMPIRSTSSSPLVHMLAAIRVKSPCSQSCWFGLVSVSFVVMEFLRFIGFGRRTGCPSVRDGACDERRFPCREAPERPLPAERGGQPPHRGPLQLLHGVDRGGGRGSDLTSHGVIVANRRRRAIRQMPYWVPQIHPGRSAGSREADAVAAEVGVIGRTEDLLRAGRAIERAAHEQPGLLLVVGEAGVGKTTLLGAARGRAEEMGFIVATGGCAPETAGTGFSAFRAALRQLCASRPSEMTAASGADPVVGALLPTSFRSPSPARDAPDPDDLYDGVLALLGELGQAAPVLLALEDVHWADRSTLELLSYLTRNLTGERVLLAATARREDLQPGAASTTTVGELGRLRNAERIDLAGLDVAAIGDLVEATGRTLTTEDVRALHDRTGGNPFYALELLDAGGTGLGPVPPSVRDTLVVRFERLRDEHAAIVRAAAVIDEIDAGVLAEIAPAPLETAETALRRGADAGLLVTDAASGVITFRHALVRDVAYSALLASERRRLHAAVARYLEATAGADPGLIVHHHVAAGQTADALRTSIAAARAAARSYAGLEAVAHYHRAVELWDGVASEQRPDVALETLLREATVAALDAAAPEGVEFGHRLLALVDPTADPVAAALDSAHIAEVLWEHHH